MSDISPRGKRILTISAIVGIIAGALGWMAFGYGWVGALCLALIVALLVAFVLLWFMPGRSESYNSGVSTSGLAGKGTAMAGGAVAAAAATGAAVASSARDTAGSAASTAGNIASTAGGAVASTAESAAKAATGVASATAAKAADVPSKAAPTAKAAVTKAKTAAPKAKAAAKKVTATKAPAVDKAAAKPKAVAAKADARPVSADGKPELLKSARASGADDLKLIKGVGPKMEGMLNDLGIYHFDQVATWRKKEVQWVDDNLEGFNGRIARDEWVKQGKILAKGGTTEFAKKAQKK